MEEGGGGEQEGEEEGERRGEAEFRNIDYYHDLSSVYFCVMFGQFGTFGFFVGRLEGGKLLY